MVDGGNDKVCPSFLNFPVRIHLPVSKKKSTNNIKQNETAFVGHCTDKSFFLRHVKWKRDCESYSNGAQRKEIEDPHLMDDPKPT